MLRRSVNNTSCNCREQRSRTVAIQYKDDDGQLGNIFTFNVYVLRYERCYYVKDHPCRGDFFSNRRIGSIRQTVRDDGLVVSAQDYLPYGEVIASRSYNLSSTEEKYKFTEKERDNESGYDYFIARYYDSDLGRWLSGDPSAHKRPGLSPYNYCQLNPINRFDPDGREDWWAFTKAVGKTVLNGFGVVASFSGMVAAGAIEGTTLGGTTPLAVPAFLASMGAFSYTSINTVEGFGEAVLAYQTPDGMEAESLSIIKKTVEGLSGSKSAGVIAKTMWDSMGMKGISNLGHEGVIQAINVISSGAEVTEDVIELLNTMADEERRKQEEKDKQE